MKDRIGAVLPFSGLKLDTLPIKAGEANISFALNACTESEEGFFPSIQKEYGNKISASIPYPVGGAINLDRGLSLLFLTDGANSEIGLYNSETNTYTTVVNAAFNFNKDYPVKGFFKIRNGCERVVYFNDWYNPDRFINLDNLGVHKTDGDFDLNKFNWSQTYSYPNIVVRTNKSGQLAPGQYRFALELLDGDQNTIGYSNITEPSYIKERGSITLSISNVDSNISFLRLHVIQYLNKSGVPATYISPTQPVTESITFSGITNRYELGTTDRLKIQPTNYVSCRDMIPVDQRIVKSNLKGKNRDYREFQKTVSKIIPKWITKQVDPDSNETGLMADEVYSVGIVFQYGQEETPVFHIVNHAIKGITYTTWNEDMIHLVAEEDFATEYPNGMPYWKIYNTASYDVDLSYGTPGYYEATDVYYNPFKDCVDDYWGKDASLVSLEGKPVRSIRMPSRSLVPLYSNGKLNLLGLTFENIEYPDPEITGHYFVYIPRTDDTKTVLDTGVLAPVKDDGDNPTFVYFDPTHFGQWHYALTPKTLSNVLIEPEYITVQSIRTQTNKYRHEEEYNDGFGANKDFYIGARAIQYASEDAPSRYNYKIEEQERLQGGQRDYTDANLSSLSFSNYIDFLKLDSPVALERDELAYVAFKVTKDNLYSNLFGQTYYKLHSSPKTLTGDQSVFGDCFASNFRVTNILLRKIKDGLLDDIIKGFAIIGAALITVATAGVASVGLAAGIGAILAAGAVTAAGIGALISAYVGFNSSIIKGTTQAIKDGEFEGFLNQDQDDFKPNGEFLSSYSYYAAEILDEFYIESEINYKLKLKNDFQCGDWFDGDVTSESEVIEYLYNRIAYYDTEEERHYPKSVICPELYIYNPDYEFIYTDTRESASLSTLYRLCTTCGELYPNRIIWSEKAFPDSRIDAGRVFLQENYTTVGEHSGQVTALHYDKNRIIVRTERSLFQLAPNPQILQTDQDTAYVGVGDFLSIPPNEIVKTSYGYGGGQGFLDFINTEHGFFTVDADAGRIFLVSGEGLQELTDQTLQVAQWFRQNLPLSSKALTYFNKVIVGYDPRFQRIILHKSEFNPSSGDISNKEQVQNKSWTLGFNLNLKTWESFFSYQPDFIWNDLNTFYTTIDDNKIWRHDSRSLCQYYGFDYPYIIEYVMGDYQTHDLECLHYYAVSKQYDGSQWNEVAIPNFNGLIAYTNNQTTGLQTLVFQDKTSNPYGSSWNNTTRSLVHVMQEYRICGLRDLAIDIPVTTTTWSKLNSLYNGRQGYIDKVPNLDNIELDRNQWNLVSLRDKWHKIRLIADNQPDTQILFDLTKNIIRDTKL